MRLFLLGAFALGLALAMPKPADYEFDPECEDEVEAGHMEPDELVVIPPGTDFEPEEESVDPECEEEELIGAPGHQEPDALVIIPATDAPVETAECEEENEVNPCAADPCASGCEQPCHLCAHLGLAKCAEEAPKPEEPECEDEYDGTEADSALNVDIRPAFAPADMFRGH